MESMDGDLGRAAGRRFQDDARCWIRGRSGRFAGLGPRGYRRADDRIREDVCDRLTDHPDVDASEVDVSVDDGVVTLAGSVPDRWQKRAAEDCAAEVSGVRDVQSRLRCAPRSELGRA